MSKYQSLTDEQAAMAGRKLLAMFDTLRDGLRALDMWLYIHKPAQEMEVDCGQNRATMRAASDILRKEFRALNPIVDACCLEESSLKEAADAADPAEVEAFRPIAKDAREEQLSSVQPT